MIHFDFEDENSKTQLSNDMIICPTHGEYPASLKKFGCPDCAREEFDEDEIDDWRDRQARKGGYKEK